MQNCGNIDVFRPIIFSTLHFRFQGTNTHRIIELVAEDSESKGMFEDSVKLYDLAKKHDKVIELLNKLLAQVISLPPVAESRRDRYNS